MQVLGRAAIALALGLPLAAPLTAQAYRWDANVNGGYTWMGNALSSNRVFDNTIFDGNLLDVNNIGDLEFRNRGIVGGQVGYWFSKNVGLRGNFAWTRTPFHQGGLELIDHVNLPSLTGDLLVRFVKPRERFTKMEWLPYIAGGLGATWVRPSGAIDFFAINGVDFDIIDGDIVEIANRDGRRGVPIVCTFGVCATPGQVGFPIIGDVFPLGTNAFFFRRATPFTGLVALGTDVRVAKQFAIRLEVGDRIWKAPIDRILPIVGFPNIFERTSSVGKTINQVYLTAGANVLFGLEAPPKRVVVAPPPRPAPPPPPPPPATEEITVCVVDPTYAQGLRTITATRHLSTGDTTVMKNGQKMPLAEAVANVPVAGTSTWYVSGAPLEIGMAPTRLQYVSVGGARNIEANELAFIGTVNGIAVFADRLTLAPGLTNLGPNTDLNRIVMESPDARKALETVSVIYVPLQPTGCVFQALQKQVEVRKK